MRGYSAVVAYGREEGGWGDYGKYKFGEFVFGTGVKFGQFKAPVNYYAILPAISVSLEERKSIDKSRSVAGYDDAVVRNRSTGGEVTINLTYGGLELLLLCVFGHEDKYSISQDPIFQGYYNHFLEFEPDVKTRPWRFGERKFGDFRFGDKKVRRFFLYVKSEGYKYLYLSNLVRSFNLSGKAGDPLQASISVEGWRRETVSADLSGVARSQNRALFPDVRLYVEDKDIPITSFSLSIERSFQRRQVSKLELDEPTLQNWEVSFEFSSRQELVLNETYVLLEVDSGSGYKYSFYLPRLIPKPVNPSIDTGRFAYSYSFFAIKPDIYPSSFPVPPSGKRREVYAVVRTTESRSFWEV